MPTAVHWSIRVCARVSLNMLVQRAPLSSLRFGAGWPSLSTAMMWRIALTNRAIATSEMANDTTKATIWTGSMNAPRQAVTGGAEPTATRGTSQRPATVTQVLLKSNYGPGWDWGLA